MTATGSDLGIRCAFFLRALATRTYLSLKKRANLQLALLTRPAMAWPGSTSDRKKPMLWDTRARHWALEAPDRAAGLVGTDRIACAVASESDAEKLRVFLPGNWQMRCEAAPSLILSIFERIAALDVNSHRAKQITITGQIALHQSRLVDLVAPNRGDTPQFGRFYRDRRRGFSLLARP
ncbi:MAG: hypothetical protein ABJI96_23425 [Paracoccaceae bacterium]